MHDDSLGQLSDDVLLATVRRLTAHSNVALAELLAHLGEVELRGIHRMRACASLYTYCICELRMSEDAACRRSKAARLVRRYPDVRDAVARGELHLTGLLMIAPFLGAERHAEVLRRARFRSKRELLRLVAELDPRPPVRALVEPLGPAPARHATHAAYAGSLAGPVRELRPGERPEDWIDGDAGETEGAPTPRWWTGGAAAMAAARDSGATRADVTRVAGTDATDTAQDATDMVPPADATSTPLRDVPEPRPLQYRVQFTASQRYADLLEEALSLLSHERPRPELPEVQLRALELLVAKLRRERRGECTAATTGRATAPNGARATGGLPGTVGRAAPARASDDAGPAPARVTREKRDASDDAGPAPARVTRETRDASDGGGPAPARRARAPRGRAGGGRYVPRGVRRAVWARDGARCAYVDDRGVRCCETHRLELHHRQPYALGGPNTTDNLELRCAAHNALAAEVDFGPAHVRRMRPSALHDGR